MPEVTPPIPFHEITIHDAIWKAWIEQTVEEAMEDAFPFLAAVLARKPQS